MRVVIAAALCLLAVAGADGAEPVTQTFPASMERVWTATHSVLKQMGWDVDKDDRAIGWINTESRRVEGEDYGVYARGTRHRLKIQLKSAAASRTTVSVAREVFKRERILWIDNDEPLTVKDRDVERTLLTAIGKAL